MRYSKSAHTRFYHRFHVVWATKYRYKVLQGPMRDRIREIIIQTCKELGVHIVKGVLARDHVHMFLSIPPKLSLSDVMQRIKGRSSRRIQIEFVQRQVEAAMSMRRAISSHPQLQKYFKVLTAGDMIPEDHRQSGITSYFDTDQGWTDMWDSWEQDDFVLDATRVTLAVGGTGWDGDTFKTDVLMDKYGIQINKTSRNTVLFMTNIGTTRSSVAYLIEVLVEIANELDELLDDASKMERLAFDRRVKNLTESYPPLPDFSRFHDSFRPDNCTPEGDIRSAYYLSYDEKNCDYLELDGSLQDALDAGREVVSASFIIPYPPGFPILVPGQVISKEILAFMRALDVNEIHGYRADLGLRVFTPEALANLPKAKPTKMTTE